MSNEENFDITNYACITSTCQNVGEITGISIEAFASLCKITKNTNKTLKIKRRIKKYRYKPYKIY